MAETLRLCTWNIQLGLQLDRVLTAIEKQPDFHNLDLLALQEASIHSDREDASAVASALGSAYDSYQVTAHFLGKYAQANALVWNRERIRVHQQDTVVLPRVRQVKLSRAERAVLYALPEQQRISVVLDGTRGDETLRAYVAHLDALGVAHKREQFFRILRDVRQREPAVDFTAVVGDLNTCRIHTRPTWGALRKAAEMEGFQDLTSEIRYTHHLVRRVRLRQKLDAIFVRSRRPMRYRSWTLDILGSDHIPVFAEIELD